MGEGGENHTSGINRDNRPGPLLHPLDRYDLRDDPDEPATPPYRANMSSLTLPPDYLAESSSDTRSRPSDSKSEKRPSLEVEVTRASSENSRHLGSDNRVLEGDTLASGRGKVPPPVTVHYPDEHGGLLHAMPSPGYPEPRAPGRFNQPEPSRTASGFTSGYAPSIAATDDEGEDADETYDWSDEEDLVDEEAKFEKKMGSAPRPKKGWGLRRIATFFVSSLVGTTILSGLLVTVPILLHFFYLEPHRTEHRTYITDNVSAWFYWVAFNFLISWYLAVLVNVLPHIVTWFVAVVWGTVTESFRSKLALYGAFKGWIKPILYAASAWASWVVIFAHIFHLHNTDDGVTSFAPYTDRLYQVVEFLFFLTLVVSLEKVLLQFIAFTFHRTAFEDRVAEVSKAIKVLDQLKDYRPKKKTHGYNRSSVQGLGNGRKTPPILALRTHDAQGYMASRPTTPDPIALEEGFAADTEDTQSPSNSGKKKKFWTGNYRKPKEVSEGYPMSPSKRGRNASGGTGSTNSPSHSPDRHGPGMSYPPISPDRRSSEDRTPQSGDNLALQAGKALKNVALHDARNIKGKDTDATDLAFNINSPHEAKKLARDLYYAFRADRKRTHLIPSDFYPAYRTPEEAKEAFTIFDKDGNENITRAEIKTTVMKVYKERRFLSRSLRDVGAAISTLDKIMLFFAMAILFFISLSVFNVNVGKSLTSVYSLGIAASFIFKNAAANAFDAIIFLFVTHPYDTGDRCFIDNENLVVKKMGLFATTFTRADGTQTYYFNSQLFNKFINNVRRSGNMFENLTMQVNWLTPLEKLDALEKCINNWIQHDDSRWFGGDTGVTLQHIDYQRSLEITIGIPHNSNWQDWTARQSRKTVFHAAVNHYSRELGISWANSPQPVLMTTESQFPPVSSLLDENDGGEGTGMGPSTLEREEEVQATVPPKPAMFFLPPRPEDEANVGLRSRKTRKKAIRGDRGA